MGDILKRNGFKSSPSFDYKAADAKGKKFTGKFIGAKENVGANKRTVYSFEILDGDMPTTIKAGDSYIPVDVEEGDTVELWGCSSLDSTFFADGELVVNPGDKLTLTYEGKKKGKSGNSYHSWVVERA